MLPLFKTIAFSKNLIKMLPRHFFNVLDASMYKVNTKFFLFFSLKLENEFWALWKEVCLMNQNLLKLQKSFDLVNKN